MKLIACRRCGAQMFFAEHERTRRRMPLDYEANPELGNVILVGPAERQCRVIGSVEERERLRDEGEDLYTSHHFTCPAKGKRT